MIAPSFENSLEQYALDTSEYLYELCNSRLQKGKHILILDAGYTQRWNNDYMLELKSQRNVISREQVIHDVAHGDMGWMTDSSSIHKSVASWCSQGNSRYNCPKSIDDIFGEDFSELLYVALRDECVQDDACKAFPAEMEEEAAQEVAAETLDGIYDEQDTAQIPLGEPSEAELREQQLLDEMPLPGFPKEEVDRRKQ